MDQRIQELENENRKLRASKLESKEVSEKQDIEDFLENGALPLDRIGSELGL